MRTPDNHRVATVSVFVLMPFGKRWDNVYRMVLRRLPERFPVKVKRADELPFDERQIYDRIIQAISSAGILIADLSDQNPNVFYEVGYAHALGKIVIPISSGPIPFDVAGFPVVKYDPERLADLKSKLSATVQKAIELLGTRTRPGDSSVIRDHQDEAERILAYATRKAKKSSWKRPNMYFSLAELVTATGIDDSLAYAILDNLRALGLATCVNWRGESVWFAYKDSKPDL
jgi:hypothetical protein